MVGVEMVGVGTRLDGLAVFVKAHGRVFNTLGDGGTEKIVVVGGEPFFGSFQRCFGHMRGRMGWLFCLSLLVLFQRVQFLVVPFQVFSSHAINSQAFRGRLC